MMTHAILQSLLTLIALGMLLRVLGNQRTATHVARETKHEAAAAATDAAAAATDAATAARTSAAILTEIRANAAVVAADLQESHDRADAVVSDEHGAAADAAATSHRETA